MKKLILSLALILALVTCSAFAEGIYTPGEPTRALMDEAFDAGQMLDGSLSMSLAIDTELLNSLDDVDPEEVSLLLDFVAALRESGAVGLTPDGLRLELGAAYMPAENRDFAAVDAALTLNTRYGALESNLIPGKKAIINWADALTVAGVPQETAQQIVDAINGDDAAISALVDQANTLLDGKATITYENGTFGVKLPEKTPEELAAEAETLDEIQQILGTVSAEAEIYGGILADWAATLNIETAQNKQIEGYPDAEMYVSVTITGADIANLMNTLADQIEQDATLQPVLDQILDAAMSEQVETFNGFLAEMAESDPDSLVDEETGEQIQPMTVPTAQDVIAGMRELAEACSTLDGYAFCHVGLSETGFYFELFDNDQDALYLGVIAQQTETPNEYDTGFSMQVLDGLMNFDVQGTFYVNPDNKNDMRVDVDTAMSVMGETVAQVCYQVSSTPYTTADGLMGYTISVSEDIVQADGEYDEEGNAELVATSVSAEGDAHETADGEMQTGSGTMSMTALPVALNFSSCSSVQKIGNLVAGSNELRFELPGIANASFVGGFGSREYDAAAFAALESVDVLGGSDEAVGALMNDAMTNFAAELEKAKAIMPDGLVELLQAFFSEIEE